MPIRPAAELIPEARSTTCFVPATASELAAFIPIPIENGEPPEPIIAAPAVTNDAVAVTSDDQLLEDIGILVAQEPAKLYKVVPFITILQTHAPERMSMVYWGFMVFPMQSSAESCFVPI